jgi:hypothetical protein
MFFLLRPDGIEQGAQRGNITSLATDHFANIRRRHTDFQNTRRFPVYLFDFNRVGVIHKRANDGLE